MAGGKKQAYENATVLLYHTMVGNTIQQLPAGFTQII